VADATLYQGFAGSSPEGASAQGLLLKDREHEDIVSNSSSSSGGTTMEEDQMEEQT
jgi:hypothetical protein